METLIKVPVPNFVWMRHKTIKAPAKSISLTEILSEEQFMLYQNATHKQRSWLEEFVRTGDSDLAALIAYPTANPASIYRLSLLARRKFNITKATIENFIRSSQ